MAPIPQPVAIVFGGTRIGNRELFMLDTHLETFLTTLTLHHVTKIDTAQAYGNFEATLGTIQVGNRFIIDTKWSPPSWNKSSTPWATKDRIIRSAEESIQKLAVNQVSLASLPYKSTSLYHRQYFVNISSRYAAYLTNSCQG